MRLPQVRRLLIVCLFLLPFQWLSAQNFEVGIFGGGTQYMGDLTETNINPETLQPVAGVMARYNLSPYFGLRLGLNAAYISGSDEFNTNEGLINRNLSFRSEIAELSLITEVNFADLNNTGIAPYIFGGVAGFYFNPRAYYNGEWIALQPLTTEGQGTSAKPGTEPYSRFALALPFGGGIKAKLSDKVTLGVEAGLRKTFTDYLDDVGSTYADPQILLNERGPLSVKLADRSGEVMPEPPNRTGGMRGDAKVTDWYGFAGVSLSISLGDGNGRKKNKKYGCPVKL